PPGEAEQNDQTDGGHDAHAAAVVTMGEHAREEDHAHEDGQPDLEHQGAPQAEHHGPTPRRARRGIVAVSTGPSAIPGATPNSTRQNTRIRSAAHSGPRASGRSWK